MLHAQARTHTLRRTAAIASSALLSVFVADQITKWIVLDRLGPDADDHSVSIIGELLQFTFVRNTGSAFGMFQGNSHIITWAALAAMIVLVLAFARNARTDPWFALAIGLQLGGAFGNLSDRIRHGYVVDFIDFPRFPTFNVADIAITCGVTLMAFCLLFRDEALHTASDSPSPQQGQSHTHASTTVEEA